MNHEAAASESERRHFRQQLDPCTGSCGSFFTVDWLLSGAG